MRRYILVLGLLIAGSASAQAATQFGGAEAKAQGGGMQNSPSIGQTINGSIPQAPIGHRQPRASDLPDEHEKNLMNANDAMSKEDAALDKKIKSICRGC
jgi:hypothetical protein